MPIELDPRFLSWGVFQPLAKISYMMYLVHITVITNLFLYTRTYSMEHNNFSQASTDMQENTWARLGESSKHQGASHAT